MRVHLPLQRGLSANLDGRSKFVPVIYVYLDRIDRGLRRGLEPQLEAVPEEPRKPESRIAAE